MEHTTYQNRSQSTNKQTASAGQQFMDGMQAYAISKPDQLRTLYRLSAAAVLGILVGIFAFFFLEAEPIADIQNASRDYTAVRTFSAYPNLRAYLVFFGAWFFHHAIPLLLPLCCVITRYPTVLCQAAAAVRGFLCGFAVCTLSGTFSPFAVYMTFAQTAVCALHVYLGTKCIRYASRRAKLPPQSQAHRTARWLFSETAPLAAAVLITLSALAMGLLLISVVCTCI